MMSSGISNFLFLVCCLAATIAVALLSLNLGSSKVDIFQLLSSIAENAEISETVEQIFNLRSTRIILALGCGGGLAVAGYVLQSVVQNPLADPFILGTASGSSFGANLVLMGIIPTMGISLMWFLPFWACLGAIMVTLCVITIGKLIKGDPIPNTLLAGIAFSSIIGSVNSLFSFFSEGSNQLRSIVFWGMGSLEGGDLRQGGIAYLLSFVLAVFLYLKSSWLISLQFGEKQAKALGFDFSKLYYTLIILVCVVVGYCTSLIGIIGFLGLLVPHGVKAVFSNGNKWNGIHCFLTGGLVLLTADFAGRQILPPSGIPSGLLTSFVGLPFFLYLLAKRQYRFS